MFCEVIIYINYTCFIFRNVQKKILLTKKNENIERKNFFHHVFTDNFDFFYGVVLVSFRSYPDPDPAK